MADITTKFRRISATLAGAFGVLVTLFGCATAPVTTPPTTNHIAYFMTPLEGAHSIEVEACATGAIALRPWSTPWERITVLSGARVDDTLRGDDGGCVRYRATLVANRQTLAAEDALLTAQSEWLMRPVGAVTQAELHVALPAERRVAIAWPRLEEGVAARVQRVGTDAEGTHVTSFVLPPLALAMPTDVLLGRFTEHTLQVGNTSLQVARVAGVRSARRR